MKNLKLFAILLAIFMCLATVPVSAASDYISKYSPIAPNVGTSYGTLYIHDLCMQNIFSKTILMRQSGTDPTWTNAIDIQLNEDGKYDGQFNPGTYDLMLLDGNAGHPEYRTVTISAGETSYVWFIGHAVSQHEKPAPIQCDANSTPNSDGVCVCNEGYSRNSDGVCIQDYVCIPKMTIIFAVYGSISHECHNETIIDVNATPGWTEHLGDYNADHIYVGLGNGDYNRTGTGVVDPYVFTYHTSVHHAAIPAVPAIPANYTVVDVGHGNGNCEEGKSWPEAQNFKDVKGDWYHKCTGYEADDQYTYHPEVPAVPAVPARTEHFGDYNADHVFVGVGHGDYTRSGSGVNDPYVYHYVTPVEHPEIPAQTHEVQICSDEGSILDVTSNVQSVVDGGVTSFLFNNARNPGGIFDLGGNLLSPIDDPAPGQVKSGHITYNMGCDASDITVSFDEYNAITLGSVPS